MRTSAMMLVFSLCLSGAAAGQDFTPSVKFLGDLRVRAEVDSRDFNLSTPPNTFTLLRTRFGVEAFPSANIRVFVMARDSRVFGTEGVDKSSNTISDGKNLDLHQGFVEIRNFLSDDIMFRVGRQELGYANERMVGAVGWNNIGRVFDGGLLRFDLPAVTADLFGMTVAEVQTYPAAATRASTASIPDNGQNFFGLYTQWKNTGTHRLDLYLLYQGNRLETPAGFIDFKRATGGAYAKGTVDGFLYEAELAYQSGERGAADIAAYAITGLAGYNIANSPLTQIAAGYEYLSGTPAGGTGYKSFDPPYATGHKFHGFMDYFINIPLHTGYFGLTDLLGRTGLKFSEKMTAMVWYHQFRTAESAGAEDMLGHELDVTATYRYAPALSFECGFSTFLPGPLMRTMFGGADAGLWGFLATAVTF